MSGVVRFIAHTEHGVLLELAPEGASASLAARFNGEFDCDPDYDTVAVAGITFGLGEGQFGCCISRSPSVEAANQAIRLLAAKYGPMQRCNRPPHGVSSQQGTTSGIDWTFDLERARYRSEVVEIWPMESSRPVKDVIVLEHEDRLTFVHVSRRANVEPCAPAAALADALSFASEASARAWVARYGASEPHRLVLRYRSVADALLAQSDCEVQDGMRG